MKFILFLNIFLILTQISYLEALPQYSPKTYKESFSSIQKRAILRIALDPAFMPYDMKNLKGKYFGFDPDMMREFSRHLGLKPEFIETKWSSLIPELIVNKADIIASGLTITEARKKQVLFSESYFYEPVGAIILPKNKGLIKSKNDLDDKNIRIGVKQGTTPDLYFINNKVKGLLRKYETEVDAANAVLLGYIDVFVFDEMFLKIFDFRNKNKVKILSNFLPGENLGVASSFKNKILIEKFNKFFKRWHNSKHYKGLIAKYFKSFNWLDLLKTQ
jgi:polar amino acid transport system substrate-binding protein